MLHMMLCHFIVSINGNKKAQEIRYWVLLDHGENSVFINMESELYKELE